MQHDRPFLGILLMLGFCVLAPLGDALAKLLSAEIAILQILLVRFIAQALLLMPHTLITGVARKLTSRELRIIALRTALLMTGMASMFGALIYLPLADAISIAFVMPFIMLLLGRFVLQETVGVHRLSACVVGFVGTLLVIQPSFAAVGWPALLPLLVALIFALFMLVTRRVAKQVDPITLQSVGSWMGLGVLIPAILILQARGVPQAQMIWSGNNLLMLMALTGVLGTLSHLLMTWSLRYAPTATLAPMQYLEIPIATLFGWMIFSDLPNGLAAIGIVITVSAGLYVIAREHRARHDPAPQTTG